MVKKGALAAASKAAAKSAKKVKAAKKTEKKEKKKKAKEDSDVDSDDDLEDILDKVCFFFVVALNGWLKRTSIIVDAAGMGGGSCSHRGDSRRSAQSTGKRDTYPVPKRESPLVYRRRVFQ